PAETMARLERDIAALGGLSVPHLRWQVCDGAPLLVRPFVAGATLAERLRSAALPPREVVGLALEILGVLERVHTAGVVHRDLKASNIILGSDGRATLVDYVLARHELLDTPVADLPPEAVAYLAPEESGLLQRPVDARANLYALGVSLYQALTGA